MTTRRRILLPHPIFDPRGGGEMVLAALVDALKDDYDLTVLTLRPIDWDAVNRFAGLSIRPDEVTVRVVARAARWLAAVPLIQAALIQRSVIVRRTRAIAGDFDLVISVNNEIDIGRRAIQYIHYPWGFWPRPEADLRWFHRIPGVLPLYYGLSSAIASVSAASIANNRTLVNSDWTGERFRERYGGQTETVYPPVTGAPLVPWSDREDAFAVIGRLVPGKHIEDAVRIIERVRAGGFDVRLHIAGSIVGRRYARHIRALARARDWITLHTDVSRPELMRIMSSVRYGLHAMPDEHFGMAPAEMARSGCIVFVPASGGQVEIVGGDDDLVVRSPDDAVAKISRVLADPALQRDLQQRLPARTARFAPERFRDRIRSVVAEELGR